ncbi:uncharacterized protein RCC_04452 [Ramularia collo-cygni]|uniref:Mediator of RNA polymerase II transcription subunit 9 n=1 Tax=Ramularia collo-cygni TaxID=112498 RepID=A0A2D3UU33_9PEZI|nr:uncharacterized protein RCC_04452 [Ramularia collo-cygni]CZT18608.1 uncharacterized protein RCC_04452 [Ramularia collo-cygni]
MANKHPIKTTTNTNNTSNLPSMPPAHTFDILPALHELLARVEQGPAATDLFPTLDDSTSESDIGSHYPPDTLVPLAPKDLPEEVLKSIKPRIRAAVRAVEALPDVDRTIEEQEEEIRMLEEKVRKQRGMLRDLGQLAEGMQGKVTS